MECRPETAPHAAPAPPPPPGLAVQPCPTKRNSPTVKFGTSTRDKEAKVRCQSCHACSFDAGMRVHR